MIRSPSTYRQLFGWWEAAVAGRPAVRHDGIAEAGFYKRRLVRGGPWVPVRIFVEREIDPDTGELTAPEVLRWEMEGLRQETDPGEVFSWLTPITKAEFDRLTDMRLRDHRYFDSGARIDLSASPTLPPGVI
jgi:hypothetical protein